MEISEKVAYLKGLMEGMKFDTESDNGKVIASVVDILEEMAKEIENLTADVDTLNEYADELDYDLGSLEEFVYDEDEDCCCCDDDDEYDDDDDYYYDDEDEEYEYLDDEDDEDFDDEDDDEDSELIEIKCPECGDMIYLSPSLEGREIECPNCVNKIKAE